MITTIILWMFNISIKTLRFFRITDMIFFIIKKSFWYGLFAFFGTCIILKAYFSFIPEMDQKVQIQYHLIGGKYFGFIFDQPFTKYCNMSNGEVVKIDFQTSFLKFQRNYLCEAVFYEENNQINFQDEYYEIILNMNANYLLPNQQKVVELTSYLIADNSINNFKQQNLIKLGERYHLSIFRFLPIRMLIKTFNKLAESLDLYDTYSKTGEINLFTNIPNHNIKISAIILEIVANEAAQFDSEITFVPHLKGIRYYLYYYFFSTLFFGTIFLTILFIFIWEIILNINIWIFILKLFRSILIIFRG